MEITHHGGNEGVTGSCHQLRFSDSHSVLIDCGSFQGRDAKRFPSAEIQFPLEGIDALVLTHVHIDHVGRIPYLIEAGFRKPIYCTPPTARFLPIMLEDSIRLGITRNKKFIAETLKVVKSLVQPVPFGEWQELPQGATFRYFPAGHILGSAYVEFDCGDERFVFSGDLGSRCTPILKEPTSPERADVLVLESTYGDRLHEGRETRIARLEAILCETLENRGVTIIPAFSLGRTQELLYELNQIMEGIGHRTQCSMLHAIDIIVDSPMALKLTDIYEQMSDYWDEEAHQVLTVDSQPFVFKNLIEIDQAGDSRGTVEYLKRSGRPAIVIAGSGMCTGGRVVEYLKTFISKPTTDIIFVGYQAYGTLGRHIQECQGGKCGITIDHQEYLVRAKTHTLSGYSAHADQSDLIHFVQGMQHKPGEIRLVHGEYQARMVLADKLNALGYKTIACTNPNEKPPVEPSRPGEAATE
jgi:metallo-beta-lactamase family protein